MNTEVREVLTEITSITRKIETDYPEIQKYLDESRETLPQGALDGAEVGVETLENYRDSLKVLIERYKKQSN